MGLSLVQKYCSRDASHEAIRRKIASQIVHPIASVATFPRHLTAVYGAPGGEVFNAVARSQAVRGRGTVYRRYISACTQVGRLAWLTGSRD